MSTQNDLGFYTLLVTPSGGISESIPVDMNGDGSISVATGGGNTSTSLKGCGVTQEGATAGRYINVKLWSAPGSFKLTVSPSQTITPGTLYGISQGYVVSVGTTSGVVTATLEAGPNSGSASPNTGAILEFFKL